jgi:5-methylcytosine-specific restriction endonuclease McrA
MRTDASYLRQLVLKRDKGICHLCRVNTLSAFLRLKKARGKSRAEMLVFWGLKKLNRRSLWDADHILPVAEGGGECDLRNLRTLCLRCHRLATAELRERLRVSRISRQQVG